MKTKDRILLTSLTLFNDEGEPNVTTVDIATEMDISPGNLYYHFKGKEAIIERLYLIMEQELNEVLQAPIKNDIDAENAWFYLYVVFEQIHKYQFFYRNIADILSRYPKINQRFSRLLKKKRATAFATLTLLEENGVAEFGDANKHSLSDSMTMLLTYWMNYTELDNRKENNTVLAIHRGVFQLMSLLAPYLHEDYQDFYSECKTLFEALSEELA